MKLELEEIKDVNCLFVYYNKKINKFRWFYSNIGSANGSLYSKKWEGTNSLDSDPNWNVIVSHEVPLNESEKFLPYVKDLFYYLECYNRANSFSLSIDDFHKNFHNFINKLNNEYTKTLEKEKFVVKEHNPLHLEYRMYGFVPYQLSGIQSGIQFGHGVVEYANKFFHTKEYGKWSTKDKTFIVLNGGTTNSDVNRKGTLNSILGDLSALGIKYATFSEPDLGDQLTSVNFLLDERVWNKEKYPFFEEAFEEASAEERTQYLMNIDPSILEAERILEIRHYISKFKLASN